jgi:hypothetical protein
MQPEPASAASLRTNTRAVAATGRLCQLPQAADVTVPASQCRYCIGRSTLQTSDDTTKRLSRNDQGADASLVMTLTGDSVETTKRLTPHGMRAGRATSMLACGASERAAQIFGLWVEGSMAMQRHYVRAPSKSVWPAAATVWRL